MHEALQNLVRLASEDDAAGRYEQAEIATRLLVRTAQFAAPNAYPAVPPRDALFQQITSLHQRLEDMDTRYTASLTQLATMLRQMTLQGGGKPAPMRQQPQQPQIPLLGNVEEINVEKAQATNVGDAQRANMEVTL